MIEELTIAIITALINGLFISIGLYIGYTKGTRKAVRIAIEEIEKHLSNNQTLQLILANLNNPNKPKPKKINKLEEQNIEAVCSAK